MSRRLRNDPVTLNCSVGGARVTGQASGNGREDFWNDLSRCGQLECKDAYSQVCVCVRACVRATHMFSLENQPCKERHSSKKAAALIRALKSCLQHANYLTEDSFQSDCTSCESWEIRVIPQIWSYTCLGAYESPFD